MAHIYDRITISMRDGIRLSGNLFRPASGQASTLLLRTPYGTQELPMAGNGGAFPNLIAFLEAGYAVLWVDCRGTFRSEGQFTPNYGEAEDGYDIVEWIISQEWSTGRVGTYGQSYMGMSQWALAGTAHPALKAVAPCATAMDFYRGAWYHPGGALSVAIATPWAIVMGHNEEQRATTGEHSGQDRIQQFRDAMFDGQAVNEFAPLAEHPLLQNTAWFTDMIDHPSYDTFWRERDLSTRIPHMTAPALAIAGWYDIFVGQQLKEFERYRKESATENSRTGSRLIVGPWDHDRNLLGRYPDREFGIIGTGEAADITGEHLRHFDRWLAEDPSAVAAEDPAPVTIFVMGTDEWRDEQDWPLPDTSYTEYFLAEGALTTEQPGAESQATITYDPRNPARSSQSIGSQAPYELADQAFVEERDDVLSFTTSPLERRVEVTGYVTAVLSVATDALDTDFTAKLVDVYPDGRALNLCDGIARLRYRTGLEKPQPAEPGERYEITVDMAATSNVFLPGHKIRIDLSSSNFPRFNRNTNTGGRIHTERIEDSVIAHNTVFSGPGQQSRLVLPIINRPCG